MIMTISWYTINDLRQTRSKNGAPGWRLSEFRQALAALRQYSSLPGTGVKALGVSSGMQVLDLVRCLPLFPDDKTGADVLTADAFSLPLGQRAEVQAMAEACVSALKIRWCLADSCLLPAPEPMPPELDGSYLWGDTPGNPASALRSLYVGGVGWMAAGEFRRRCPRPGPGYFRYPLVLNCRADGVTADGRFLPLELSPWEFRRLERRTLARLRRRGKEVVCS